MEERQGEPITLFRLHVYSRESQKEEKKKERRVRSLVKRDERERYLYPIYRQKMEVVEKKKKTGLLKPPKGKNWSQYHVNHVTPKLLMHFVCSFAH